MAQSKSVKPGTALRIGTRTSQLALWQTHHVIDRLKEQWPGLECEVVHLVTQGDKRLDRPLPEIGGKGLFTAELEDGLRAGDIDLAVHSLKDLPVDDANGLVIGAILSREDPRDVLVAREGWTLATLPKGAVVGTSSLRRQAQLLALRPDLEVRSIRGNVDTRVRKVLDGEYDAAMMAGAGLKRLGITQNITEWIDPVVILPAPGQGALAVQCRDNDELVLQYLATIHDAPAAATTTAERQLLAYLGGGCSAPIGAWAQMVGGQIHLQARVVTVDGSLQISSKATGSDPFVVAKEVADEVLASGGARLLLRVQPTSTGPLRGKRVVVTRPNQNTGEANWTLESLLQEKGAIPLVIPLLELVAVPDNSTLQGAIQQIDSYDWIIFTSPAAVEFFWAEACKPELPLQPEKCQVAAIGPTTKAALIAHGVPVNAMPSEYLASELSGVMGELNGTRILLPRSELGGQALVDDLHRLGAKVDDIAIYTPVPVTLDEESRKALADGVDVVTFASGSAVRSFISNLEGDHRFDDYWAMVKVACIGPATAEVATSLGLPVHIVAKIHTAAGLVEAVCDYFVGDRAKSIE